MVIYFFFISTIFSLGHSLFLFSLSFWENFVRGKLHGHLNTTFFCVCSPVCLVLFSRHRKPPTYKSVIQANGSAKKKHKEEKPPDLWINHTDNIEMKPVEAVNPAPDVTNTSTIPR